MQFHVTMKNKKTALEYLADCSYPLIYARPTLLMAQRNILMIFTYMHMPASLVVTDGVVYFLFCFFFSFFSLFSSFVCRKKNNGCPFANIKPKETGGRPTEGDQQYYAGVFPTFSREVAESHGAHQVWRF